MAKQSVAAGMLTGLSVYRVLPATTGPPPPPHLREPGFFPCIQLLLNHLQRVVQSIELWLIDTNHDAGLVL